MSKAMSKRVKPLPVFFNQSGFDHILIARAGRFAVVQRWVGDDDSRYIITPVFVNKNNQEAVLDPDMDEIRSCTFVKLYDAMMALTKVICSDT
jgi:hypothetical protein